MSNRTERRRLEKETAEKTKQLKTEVTQASALAIKFLEGKLESFSKKYTAFLRSNPHIARGITDVLYDMDLHDIYVDYKEVLSSVSDPSRIDLDKIRKNPNNPEQIQLMYIAIKKYVYKDKKYAYKDTETTGPEPLFDDASMVYQAVVPLKVQPTEIQAEIENLAAKKTLVEEALEEFIISGIQASEKAMLDRLHEKERMQSEEVQAKVKEVNDIFAAAAMNVSE